MEASLGPHHKLWMLGERKACCRTRTSELYAGISLFLVYGFTVIFFIVGFMIFCIIIFLS